MGQRRSPGAVSSCAVAVGSLWLAALAAAQSVAIDHQPVACIVADRFPALTARLEPVNAVSRARTYFRASGSPAWYYTEMKAAEGGFRAVLPKPKKSLKRMDYYLEVTGRDVAVTRTAEYGADVVSDAASCHGGMMAASAVGSASVTIAAVGSAPSIPVGFSGSGIAGAAGGGGIGTTTAIVGGVGAAAAAAAVVAVKKASDEESCGPGDTLTVVERSATTLTLQWSFREPSPVNCYTVDFLTNLPECQLPPHNNIQEVRGTSVTLTGLASSALYNIHVHPLSFCPGGGGGGGSTLSGSTNAVSVRTLAPGAASQSVTRSDYSSCCS